MSFNKILNYCDIHVCMYVLYLYIFIYINYFKPSAAFANDFYGGNNNDRFSLEILYNIFRSLTPSQTCNGIFFTPFSIYWLPTILIPLGFQLPTPTTCYLLESWSILIPMSTGILHFLGFEKWFRTGGWN